MIDMREVNVLAVEMLLLREHHCAPEDSAAAHWQPISEEDFVAAEEKAQQRAEVALLAPCQVIFRKTPSFMYETYGQQCARIKAVAHSSQQRAFKVKGAVPRGTYRPRMY